MNKYEMLYILDTELDEETRASIIERVKNTIEESGEVDGMDEWGTRKLAYEINKKNEGYYVKVNFKANPELPKELTRVFRITEGVMRYLIINEDE